MTDRISFAKFAYLSILPHELLHMYAIRKHTYESVRKMRKMLC